MIENYTQSVHIYVPIALIIIGLLSVLIDFISKSQSFKKASFYLLIIATVGLTIFYISGNNESDLRNQNEITASSQYNHKVVLVRMVELLPIIDPEIMMNSTTENQGEFIHSVSL